MKIDIQAPLPSGPMQASDMALRAAAEAYEAAFLAEMLKPMGAAATRESFGGGVGEAQFGSFLLQEEARAIVQHGGIGLSESIFEALKAQAEPGPSHE